MATKIKLRGDTSSAWLSANPVLEYREMGIETDTNNFKFGNGTSAWTVLPYVINSSMVSAHNVSLSAHQDIRDLITRDNNVLSAYAPLSGANFFGNITALNLSGTNTGDQELSAYAFKTFVISSISEHNLSSLAHSGIRNDIITLSGSLSAYVPISVMTLTDEAPTTGGTLNPDMAYPLQNMTTGTIGGGAVSITLAVPSGSSNAGDKLEIWITANDTTYLNISAYTIPSDCTVTSPITLTAAKTYIFLIKKGLSTNWYLSSIVGGY